MVMYDELVRQLRYCADATTCRHCPWRSECCLHDAQRKAADAIEELSRDRDSMNDANIALYGALPQWIPVTERLPEEYTRVIGFMAWKAMTAIEYQNGKWHSINHLEPLPDEAVTHWMPLPEPPKDGE